MSPSIEKKNGSLLSGCGQRTMAALTVLLTGLLLAFSAEACRVPVFRWALERWPSDRYEMRIFYHALSEMDRVALRVLEQRIGGMNPPPNLLVLEGHEDPSINASFLAMRKGEPGRPPPAGILLYPRGAHVSAPVWSGSPSELSPDVLLDSPVRSELARRILAGHSGVWLLLKSGDPAKDEAAGRVLTEGIEQANQTLRLPDVTGGTAPIDPEPSDLPNLRIEFSRIDVERADPAEAMLVRMLLGIEPDLASYDEPMAFPVYGRGRVLYALVGKGINTETVAKAHAFLAGPCACEIKTDNPGTDLLMAVDWDKSIGDNTMAVTAEWLPLPGRATNDGFREAIPQPRPKTYGFMRNAMLTVAAIAALLAVATFIWPALRGGR